MQCENTLISIINVCTATKKKIYLVVFCFIYLLYLFDLDGIASCLKVIHEGA